MTPENTQHGEKCCEKCIPIFTDEGNECVYQGACSCHTPQQGEHKEEWEERFIKFIEPALDRGFDDGYRGADLDKAQKAYRDRFAWMCDIRDFIRTERTAILTAKAEELLREVEGMKKKGNPLDDAHAFYHKKDYNRALTDIEHLIRTVLESK